MLTAKPCKVCKNEFIPRSPKQTCCSNRCKGLVATMLRVPRACLFCGMVFQASPRQKYCQHKCAEAGRKAGLSEPTEYAGITPEIMRDVELAKQGKWEG